MTYCYEINYNLQEVLPKNTSLFICVISAFHYHAIMITTLSFQWCNETSSASTWTNRYNVSCDDGDKCTRSDTCTNGQCTGVTFTCNSQCQTCNGFKCTQKTGFGFVNGSCTCVISGK